MNRFSLRQRMGIVGLLGVFALVFHSQIALADDVYGKIRGTVVDPTGAAIVGAKVTTTNVATGIFKEVVSGADGSYEFLQLAAPGTYQVSAQQAGFKAFQAHGIHLDLNQVYVLNIKLEVGTVTQTVVVEAAPAQVETTTMQLGITMYFITDLPLNGRNWVQLQQTLPGVVAASDRFTTNFATNGGRSQANDYLVNGTDANDLPLNNIQVVPSPDAIAEVTLITNTINPEYGRNGGAVLNATTKSGSNAFHGDAFEFYRDTGLNTTNFFSTKTTVFHRNQYGGVIGGPIKKDKAFFFFSYQGTKDRRPQAGGTSTVYTPAERGGDFSADTAGAFPSVNPNTGAAAVSPFPLVGENGTTFPAGTLYSTLFPTGHIPTADFNPVALNLMKTFVPLPTTGNTFEFNPITTSTTKQYITRIDYNMTSKDSIWGYWFIQPNSATDSLPFFGANLPGFPEQSTARTQHYTVAWSHTFNPSMVNEARMGYQRLNFVAVEPVTPVLPSSVGFTGINPQSTAGAGVPFVGVSGLFNLGFSQDGPQPRIDQTYHFTDNFSKFVGRHSLKFGFEIRRSQVKNPFFFLNNGAFTFAGSGSFSTSIAGADFLLGIPDSYAQSNGGIIQARTQTYYSYAQDQFRLRPNFTVTYGIGWEVDTPLHDIFNKDIAVNCFIAGQQSTVFPTAPAGLNFPGDKGCNDAGGVTTHFKDFAPRIGFAWSPGSSRKWSIRAGYGIYFNRVEEELDLQNLIAPPFSLSSSGAADTPLAGSPAFATPFTDISGAGSIPNKFPFTAPKVGSNVDFTFFEPFILNTFLPNFSNPYSQNYNLTIQRELPSAMILTVSYVGSVGHKLTRVFERNPAGSEAGNPVCKATPGCNSFNNFITAPQSFRFPQTNSSGLLIFGSIGTQETAANSNYNSLQLTVEKHLTHGLQFRATYSYSHSLDSASSFEDLSNGRNADPFNARNDYGNSTFDARQRFVVSYLYGIPSVRRFHAFQWMPSRITDGWKIAGATTLQAGFPISIFDGGFRSFTCDANFSLYGCFDRPNFVGPTVQTFDPRTSSVANLIRSTPLAAQNHYYFNPNNFAREALGTIGNAGRNFFHGPGLNNTDLAFWKETKISESTSVQLRIEFFNIFNHAQFQPVASTSGANGDSNSRSFGRILNARPAGIDSRIIQLAAKFVF